MKTNAELAELSHRLGELIHNWGFKRIHGRIWTRLFLSTRPLDAADLIQQLDISKALVSISIRELLDLKAVEEVGRSARGTNLYRANGNLNEIYLQLLRRREQPMLEQTSAALSVLSNLDAVTLNEAEISTSQIQTLSQHLTTAMGFVSETLADSNSAAVATTSAAPAPVPMQTPVQESVISFPTQAKAEYEARA